jgi:hypothetical protein
MLLHHISWESFVNKYSISDGTFFILAKIEKVFLVGLLLVCSHPLPLADEFLRSELDRYTDCRGEAAHKTLRIQ